MGAGPVNRFKVVVTGRDCADTADACLASIAEQDDPAFDVCVVDDVSTDGTRGVVRSAARRYGWLGIANQTRRYALANQVAAWTALDPGDDDVVVFVDLDDRLARPDALSIIRGYYRDGALITYGSYRAEPEWHPSAGTCRPAAPYDREVVQRNGYRGATPWFNHLRTVSWRALGQVTERDLRDDRGDYWRAATDLAVMLPALELAGERATFVPEVLYVYNCGRDSAVWRVMNDRLAREARAIRSRPRRERLR